MPPARALFYLTTLGVLVLTVRAIFAGPPPLYLCIVISIAYVAMILVGVLSLRLRVFVDAVTRGPAKARGVALTFDDGPHPVFTRKVLDLLDRAGVRATFFLIARKAEQHPALVREIIQRGHSIGLHSYAHDRLFAMRSASRVRRDLQKGLDVLQEITGTRPDLFRPPIGHSNPTIARVAAELELTIVGWTESGHDGLESAQPTRVVSRIRAALSNRAIVLLHDAPEQGEYEPAAIRALPGILEAIADQRLCVVPLEGWL